MTARGLSHEKLLSVLAYNPRTGQFLWRTTRSWRAMAGSVAGTIHANWYRRIKIDGVMHAAHRLAWFYVNGVWPIAEIDHKNLSKADNRIKNLRAASRCQNQQNRLSGQRESGLKGTYLYSPGKWASQITANRKKMSLGYFDTPEAAHAAYIRAANNLHGQFARTA